MPGGDRADVVIDDIFKASAYGDLDKLKEFIERTPSAVNQTDAQGYRPLQWACLNNRVAAATYLLSRGASADAADHTGQTALHWTAVRASVGTLEVLLRHIADIGLPAGGLDPTSALGDGAGDGAALDVPAHSIAAVRRLLELGDARGYTVMHVASQYGHANVVYHLAMRWNADIDGLDLDDRTPLHWAAYKGFVDATKLLLFLNASPNQKDKEGCTPLHWASIRGNIEAVNTLLQGGAKDSIYAQDVTGSTPQQLAAEKGHRHVAGTLASFRKSEERSKRVSSSWSAWNRIVTAMQTLQMAPVIWMLIIGLVYFFLTSVVNSALFLYHPLGLFGAIASWIVVGSSSIGLIFLYRTTTADPGFVRVADVYANSPHMREKGSSGMRARTGGSATVNHPALWSGEWERICVTCKLVRPLRAKHCKVTGRCVEHFDHFCPWVGNVIGRKNRRDFIIFLTLETIALVTSCGLALLRLASVVPAPGHPSGGGAFSLARLPQASSLVIFLVADFIVLLSVATLCIVQISQVCRNVTTNELANSHRYRYLRGPDGLFHNPFDLGWYRNVWDFMVETYEEQPQPLTSIVSSTMPKRVA